MDKYSVIKLTRDSWNGDDSRQVVLESESEIACYRQALLLQKLLYNPEGSPFYTEYIVEECK